MRSLYREPWQLTTQTSQVRAGRPRRPHVIGLRVTRFEILIKSCDCHYDCCNYLISWITSTISGYLVVEEEVQHFNRKLWIGLAVRSTEYLTLMMKRHSSQFTISYQIPTVPSSPQPLLRISKADRDIRQIHDWKSEMLFYLLRYIIAPDTIVWICFVHLLYSSTALPPLLLYHSTPISGARPPAIHRQYLRQHRKDLSINPHPRSHAPLAIRGLLP